MASKIDRRLRALEEISGITSAEDEEWLMERRCAGEALERMSFEELGYLEAAMRHLEAGSELTDQDREILQRDGEIREEVRHELTGPR